MKMKNIYLIIILLMIAIVTMIVINAKSKYALEKQTLHAQNSEKFYLESNLLKVEEEYKVYNDWDGESNYKISFTVRNYEDEMRINTLGTSYTVVPTITYPTENSNITVNTTINGESINAGQMQANVKQIDNIEITINPNGENLSKIGFELKVISSVPYQKTLAGNFEISKINLIKYVANVNDVQNQEYGKLLIRTDEYTGTLRIYYNNSLSEPDMTCQLLDGVTKQNYSGDIYYIDVNLQSNFNYQIDFIKKNVTNVLTLGHQIANSDIFVAIP